MGTVEPRETKHSLVQLAWITHLVAPLTRHLACELAMGHCKSAIKLGSGRSSCWLTAAVVVNDRVNDRAHLIDNRHWVLIDHLQFHFAADVQSTMQEALRWIYCYIFSVICGGQVCFTSSNVWCSPCYELPHVMPRRRLCVCGTYAIGRPRSILRDTRLTFNNFQHVIDSFILVVCHAYTR